MREKLIELPVADAILILKEELKQRTDGYTTYLANGGKGDPAEEVSLDALAMAISALEQTKWIPVTERLPERFVYVLAMTDFGETAVARLKGNGRWYIGWDNDQYDGITHWMPLPEPPKGE